MMNRTRSARPALAAAALLLLAADGLVPADTGHGGGTATVVRGEILDLACYVAHGGKGPEHAKCALKCAEQGQPIGLLADDGKVYVLFADHADGTAFGKAKRLAGKRAEIRGETAARDGITGLTVLAVSPL